MNLNDQRWSWIAKLLQGLAVTAVLAGTASGYDAPPAGGATADPGGSGQGGEESERGDDIGTLPASAAPVAPGVILTGTASDLTAVLLDVVGHGQIQVRPIEGTLEWQVEFHGDLLVILDSDALGLSDVEAYFFTGTTLAGGTAALNLNGVWSSAVTLQPFDTYGLPLSFFAAQPSAALISATQGDVVYGLQIAPTGDQLVLSQSLQQ